MSATADVVRAVPGQVRPLRRAEYERLVADGALGDDLVELLQGVLVEMTTPGPAPRRRGAVAAADAGAPPPPEFDLRVQLPLAAGPTSEPEPDLAVVPSGRYRTAHADKPLLVVEVARTSQALDLGAKAALYASGYARRTEHRDGLVAAATLPGVTVDVAELFG